MTEPGTGQGLPWATVLTLGALGAVLAGVYRLSPTAASPVPWSVVWAPVAAGLAAFLILRWLQNYLWGIAAGLFLPLHPFVRSAAEVPGPGLDALALVLIVLTATLGGWRLAFLPRFAWRRWSLVAGVLIVATGLAWPFHPRTGLVAAVLAGVGLLGSSVLAARLRARKGPVLPSWGNVTAAALLGLLTPAAGLALAPVEVRFLDWPPNPTLKPGSDARDYVEAGLDPNLGEYRLQGFTGEEPQAWGWPAAWVVRTLMLWGFWRSFRRGWRLWRRARPPVAWVLTLYAVVGFTGAALHSGEAGPTTLLTLASLAVLLSVFGIADLVRGFMERLVLAPPQEREE